MPPKVIGVKKPSSPTIYAGIHPHLRFTTFCSEAKSIAGRTISHRLRSSWAMSKSRFVTLAFCKGNAELGMTV